MTHRPLAIIPIVALFVSSLMALPASAANGLAFDSVNRFIMGTDTSSLAPGTFDADFQAASQPAPQSHGGMFGAMQNAAAGMQGMMQHGTAERHYIAGSKERTDQVASQTATILDCSARTLTTMDLKAKTYRVVSLDQPSSGSGGGSSKPAPRPTDDGSKVAIVVTNKALGAKDVSGQNTSGYSSDMKMTVTKANGETNTSDMSVTSYYTNMAQPRLSCYGGRPSTAAPQMSMLSSYQTAVNAMRDAKGNPRFTVSSSGPALPVGMLSMWDLVTFNGERQASILTERGNVRSITDADSAFSVPSDFTKLS
jgi:hypothetical protein